MTPPVHEYSAPWGTALKTMSGLFTLLLLGIAWLGIRTEADMGAIWYASMVGMPLLLLAIGLNYTVLGYRLTPDRLRVRRLGWFSECNLDGLEAVAADSGAMVGSRRVLANGGLFSFSGRFRNKHLGIYRALATDPDRAVILRWSDRTLVITPDDPERFVRQLCELRGLEVQRPE
ncbi:MAG: PH domain-containing protein [Halofilum sp. (in: g-proteobacteria)]|nr:PH domain-containing protein [Halofilum sp. (in: g-proteobacteria)]